MAEKSFSRDEIQSLYFKYTKHPWIYPFIAGLICILDVVLIVLYYYNTYVLDRQNLILLLLLAHVGLTVGLYFNRRRSSPQTKNISPVLFLVIPGVGGLIYGVPYMVLYGLGSKNAQIEYKHAYTEEEEIKYETKVSVDFSQISKLMDMSGVFSYSNALNKKEVIVDLLSSEIIQNCKTLKRGLDDEDPEVVHYTATTLNYLENKFEQSIREARDAAAEDLTKKNLEALVTLYENYIFSGLLDDDIVPIYMKKIIEILELHVDTFGTDLDVVKHLARCYMKQGKGKETLDLLQEVARENPDDVEIQFTLMNYFYEEGDLVQVKNLAMIIDSIGDNISEEQRKRIQFWIQDETEETEEKTD